jgi:nucleoside-diphosphate-sugar epimerase
MPRPPATLCQEAAPEMVVHLAAAGVTDPFLPVATAIAHNVTGTLNLLQACCERPGKLAPIVVARTPGERDAQNHYAASKAAAWQFCRMYVRTRGWPIAGAMVYQAYGPGQPERALVPAALAAARAGADFAMTSGRQVRDWIYVDDVVAGLLAMIARPLPPGETVELGTGRGTTVGEVVDRIYALAGGGGRPLRGSAPGPAGREHGADCRSCSRSYGSRLAGDRLARGRAGAPPGWRRLSSRRSPKRPIAIACCVL